LELGGQLDRSGDRNVVRGQRGSSWDPTVIGPLDRCLRCWTPVSTDRGYCRTCGKTTLVFSTPVDAQGQACFRHADRVASRFCCLCSRPICEECKAKETFPMTTVASLWHCRECVAESSGLESEFFATLKRAGSCAKDGDTPAAFSCKTCSLPLCLSCAYFTAKGLFRKRVDDGPFCLACFRMATLLRSRQHWFSGHDVSPAML